MNLCKVKKILAAARCYFCIVIIGITFSILNISCKNNSGNAEVNSIINSAFKELKIEKSEFERVGNSFKYKFKCNVKNISSNIFNRVYTTLDVQFILENGKVITETEYQDLWGGGIGDYQETWKPEEVRNIGKERDLPSAFIPEGFKDYPISKVIVMLKYHCDDLINQTKEDYYTSIDITDVWVNFVGKIKCKSKN